MEAIAAKILGELYNQRARALIQESEIKESCQRWWKVVEMYEETYSVKINPDFSHRWFSVN